MQNWKKERKKPNLNHKTFREKRLMRQRTEWINTKIRIKNSENSHASEHVMYANDEEERTEYAKRKIKRKKKWRVTDYKIGANKNWMLIYILTNSGNMWPERAILKPSLNVKKRIISFYFFVVFLTCLKFMFAYLSDKLITCAK